MEEVEKKYKLTITCDVVHQPCKEIQHRAMPYTIIEQCEDSNSKLMLYYYMNLVKTLYAIIEFESSHCSKIDITSWGKNFCF